MDFSVDSPVGLMRRICIGQKGKIEVDMEEFSLSILIISWNDTHS